VEGINQAIVLLLKLLIPAVLVALAITHCPEPAPAFEPPLSPTYGEFKLEVCAAKVWWDEQNCQRAWLVMTGRW